MFHVIDQNGDTDIAYSVRSRTEHKVVEVPVQIGGRESNNCVEIQEITEFLLYNWNFHEWIWVESTEFKPLA